MRAFCGWVGVRTGEPHELVAKRMLAREISVAGVTAVGGDGWALALASGPSAGEVSDVDGVRVLLVGAPRSRVPGRTPAESVAACLRGSEDHVQAAGGVGGPFAALAIDPRAGAAIALVDRFATVPLYFARAQDGAVFASSPRIVAEHPLVEARISNQAIYEYLYASVVPAPLTIYQDVEALRASRVLLLRDGQTREAVHWTPRFVDEGPTMVGTGAERQVLDLLREAVAGSMQGDRGTGCFLSGGIDSSTVTGCARDVGGEPPRTFTIGFDAEGYDEMSFARAVAEHFGAEHHEYYVTPDDILDLIPRIVRAFGQPFGNSSVIPAFHCAAIAREAGVERMLAGDGGDELFGGNERYAKNWLYSRYARLPAALRAPLDAWAGCASPPLGDLPLLRKAVSYVRHANVPMPGRMEVYNHLDRTGAERIFSADFLARIDRQRIARSRAEVFHGADSHDDVNRMLALDFDITLADNDLKKVTVMCREAGVDVCFPFLDDDVVDFSLTLPASDKVRRRDLRHFFRKAVTGYLPDVVIRKSKHGFGLPFGPWAVSHAGLREWVGQMLGAARARGIVDPTFLDTLHTRLLPEHPGYYGPLVWLIAMLEGWLEENA